MARNQVFADIESTREVWTLAAETKAGVAVMQGNTAGVTLSGTPGITQGFTLADGTVVSGIPQPSNGQGAKRSTVHTTGTFEFPIATATAATTQGTDVYFVAADGSLTLVATGHAFYGRINLPEGYVVRGTTLPVKIGVVA